MFIIRRSVRRKISLIFTSFIPTRKLRKKIRRKITQDDKVFDYSDQMCLGVTYSVWDGEELLEASLRSIRKNTDYINVVWQVDSWSGKRCSEGLEDLLKELKEKQLLDHYVLYTPQRTTAARNEKIKRQVGVDDLKKNQCTHFLIMDVDEFYIADELRRAKSFIVEHQIEHSACGFYNYAIQPTYRRVDVAPFSVQFISKLKESTQLGTHNRYCIIDPTRLSDFTGMKVYYFNTVQMHHMESIRNDLKEKFMNSSAFQNNGDALMEDYQSILEINDQNYTEQGLVKVENRFDIAPCKG